MNARYQQQLIDSAAAYDARATLNRPKDARAMRAAIHELRNRGMSDYMIASATALSVEYVRRVLGERTDESVQP